MFTVFTNGLIYYCNVKAIFIYTLVTHTVSCHVTTPDNTTICPGIMLVPLFCNGKPVFLSYGFSFVSAFTLILTLRFYLPCFNTIVLKHGLTEERTFRNSYTYLMNAEKSSSIFIFATLTFNHFWQILFVIIIHN